MILMFQVFCHDKKESFGAKNREQGQYFTTYSLWESNIRETLRLRTADSGYQTRCYAGLSHQCSLRAALLIVEMK
jgi:hypothetical protein